MRKILMFICISFAAGSYAQINSGSKVVELNFGFNSNQTELFGLTNNGYSKYEVRTRSININPSLGISLGENKLIHIGGQFSSSKFERPIFISSSTSQDDKFTSVTNIYSIIIGFEQLFGISEKIYLSPFFSGAVGFGITDESGSQGFDRKLNQIVISLAPKIYYFINERWSLIGSVSFLEYTRNKEEVEAPNGENIDLMTENFNSTLGFNSMTLGVTFLINNSSE